MRINPWKRVVASAKCCCGLCHVTEYACLLQGLCLPITQVCRLLNIFILEEGTVSSSAARSGDVVLTLRMKPGR